MLAAFRSRLTFANVVSLVALFVALSGGAYALTIPRNSVGAKQLKKNAVTAPKIKRNAVTSPKVRNDSLTGADIRNDSLTGGDLDERTFARVPSADTANSANTANTLGGQGASAFQTASASDARSDVAAPQGTISPALSATITTSAPRTLTAIASVTVSADGGGNDNINCRINIDGVSGANQSTYITPNGLDDRTTVPLTHALSVEAGTHTVLVQCGDGVGSNTSLEDRFLTVVATG